MFRNVDATVRETERNDKYTDGRASIHGVEAQKQSSISYFVSE